MTPIALSHTNQTQVSLPLDVSTLVHCRYRDGKYYPARIIERRKAAGSEAFEYYVHYRKCETRFAGRGWMAGD